MFTLQHVLDYLTLADKAVDFVAPLVGQPELAPVADALTALVKKVEDAKNAAAVRALPAEVKAADAAAQFAEAVKFRA